MTEFDLLNVRGFSTRGMSGIDVILGKNGCGKSYLLKQLEQGLRGELGFGEIRYVSPERGGVLQYEPNVDNNISQNPTWLNDNRRSNQSSNFRQQSFVLFRRLELAVLRLIETEQFSEGYIPRTFATTLEKLNILLDRVRLVRDNTHTFRLVDKVTNQEVPTAEVSSGEAELISLGIEFLSFIHEAKPDRANVLLVDEPDVHLHPDLQYRLARFIIEVLADQPVTLILATHSTALLAGLAGEETTRVAFMRRGDTQLDFKSVSEVDRAILPIFGAHPLSNVFNQSPVLLIEGEDDERIWQQGVRSAQGALRLYPCVVGSVDRFSEFETEVNNVIEAVYDDATAFSLRDRDLQPEAIADVGHVRRMRLACRTAENLMLTDDVLQRVGTDWQTLRGKIEAWAAAFGGHQYHADVVAFLDGDCDRMAYRLKNVRNILAGLMTNRPWEVVVGQSIAALACGEGLQGEHSLRSYLGAKVCTELLGLGAAQEAELAAE